MEMNKIGSQHLHNTCNHTQKLHILMIINKILVLSSPQHSEVGQLDVIGFNDGTFFRAIIVNYDLHERKGIGDGESTEVS